MVYMFSIFLGLAAGVIPVGWGAYFAGQTSPEDRGRVMGVSVGIMMLIAQFFLIFDIFNFDAFNIGSMVNVKISVVGGWLLVSYLALAFRPGKKKKDEVKGTSSSKRKKGPRKRQIVLYAIPIFLFYWVAGILLSIVFPTVQNNFENQFFYLIWALPFFLGSIMGGIFLDLQGRKFPSIVGLALTGVSLAIFGVIGIHLTNLVLILLAIGFSFITVLSFIIWADLAPPKAKGTYYGAGLSLMSTALMMGLISTGVIFGSVAFSQISSYMLLSSVALFLCIPPIIMAEETLPKEVIEQRQMLEYLDGVKNMFGRKKQD
jgi:MFS family permease